MTANPLPPAHPLTIDEYLTIDQYLALGENEHIRTELQEGSLLMTPSPTPDHMVAILQLAMQLTPQVPEDFEVVPDVDIDLEFALSNQPGSSRRPDLVVVDRSARKRVRDEGGMLRASEVVLVVEIASTGSRRTDNVIKRAEYADAGIENYWILDIDKPVSIVACRLTEEFGYVDDGAGTHAFTTSAPFDVEIDLDRLT